VGVFYRSTVYEQRLQLLNITTIVKEDKEDWQKYGSSVLNCFPGIDSRGHHLKLYKKPCRLSTKTLTSIS